jgi:GPR1/FUN34/yaaH family
VNNLDHSPDHHYEDHTHHTLNHGSIAESSRVFYVIDAESLKSGMATINVKVPMANPSPLGLLGFGLTTFLLNMHNAGVFGNSAMIMAMGLCYGGLA